MEAKTPHTSGRPVQGGESNHPYNTTLWFRLQVVEAHLLPLLIVVERVVGEVCA